MDKHRSPFEMYAPGSSDGIQNAIDFLRGLLLAFDDAAK
jgi:hypothetical protein